MRFGGADSSPQHGCNWLLSSCVYISRDAVIPTFRALQRLILASRAIPLGCVEVAESAQSVTGHDTVLRNLTKEHDLPAALGHGAEDTAHKCAALLHKWALRVGQRENSRSTPLPFSFCSDMGVELGVAKFRYDNLAQSGWCGEWWVAGGRWVAGGGWRAVGGGGWRVVRDGWRRRRPCPSLPDKRPGLRPPKLLCWRAGCCPFRARARCTPRCQNPPRVPQPSGGFCQTRCLFPDYSTLSTMQCRKWRRSCNTGTHGSRACSGLSTFVSSHPTWPAASRIFCSASLARCTSIAGTKWSSFACGYQAFCHCSASCGMSDEAERPGASQISPTDFTKVLRNPTYFDMCCFRHSKLWANGQKIALATITCSLAWADLCVIHT